MQISKALYLATMKIKVLRTISTTDGLLYFDTTPDVKDALARQLIKRGYAEPFVEPKADEDEAPAPAPTTQRKPRKSRK